MRILLPKITPMNQSKSLKKESTKSVNQSSENITDYEVVIAPGNKDLEIKVSAKEVFGTMNQDVIHTMLRELLLILPNSMAKDSKSMNAAIDTLRDYKPEDSYERMIISQIIVCHNMAMEFLRRAMLSDQTEEGVDKNVNRSAKMMRAFTKHNESLMKYRGKGDQKIQVQHINVQDQAQAIVGDVKGGK